jgi:hypothetical protein
MHQGEKVVTPQKTTQTKPSESTSSDRVVQPSPNFLKARHPLLQMQTTAGNRAVQRMIIASSPTGISVQREIRVPEADSPTSNEGEIDLATYLESGLNSSGHLLEPKSKEFMEDRFGYDLSGVTLHTDAISASSARAFDAKAYTVGHDIVFGAGQYSPGTSEGQRLIAHELAHVVQSLSSTATPDAADGHLAISEPSDESELSAEATAAEVMNGRAAEQGAASGLALAGTVQRDEDEGWLGSIGSAISSVGSAVESGVSSVVDTGASIASDVGSAAGSAWEGAKGVAGDVADVAGSAWQGAKGVAGDVADVAGSAWQGAKGAAGDVADVAGSAWQGAKGVAGDVADVAGSAWQGAKGVAGDVADFGKEVYGQMKTDAGYVQKGVGAVGEGVDWLEGEAKAGTSWVANKAEGIPVLSQLANAGKSYVDFNVDVLGGAAKGVTGLAGGIVGAAADPVDTAKALYTMSEHIPGLGLPQKLLGGAYDLATGKSAADVADETLNPMSDAKYWGNVGKGFLSPYAQAISEGKPGEVLGRAGVDIGSLLIGAGEAGEAGKVAQLAEAADASKVADVADIANVADVADASKVADVSDASKAATVPPEPVQVPIDPNVNPTGPTQLPPGPTELPPPSPLSPDFLENPGIPKAPPLPTIPDVPPGGFPELPPSPATALEAPANPALRGMDIQTLGTPTGEIGSLTDAEISSYLDGMEGSGRSSSFFEMPGQNPVTGGGLQDIRTNINPNPNQISYSVNHSFSDLANPRIADMSAVPTDAVREVEGMSVIPEGTGMEADAVPRTYMADPVTDNSLLNSGGNRLGSSNAEVRYHSANPQFPDQGPTVQVNTPADRFGWAGDRSVAVEGQQARYMLPDGTWKRIADMTDAERAAAHWPTGG